MTRFHYNLKQWVESLEKEIARAFYLCTKYPDDPRYEETLSALNIYEKLRNYITGSDDCVPLVPDYDYMVQCWKESQSLNKKGLKGFQKIETTETVEAVESVETVQEVTIAQTQVSQAPELVGNVDVYAMEDQLHLENMEEIPVVKKKKKVKTS